MDGHLGWAQERDGTVMRCWTEVGSPLYSQRPLKRGLEKANVRPPTKLRVSVHRRDAEHAEENKKDLRFECSIAFADLGLNEPVNG